MVDLYFWTTPNGYKIAIFLEETGLDYKIIPVDIGSGAQFEKSFLAIAPNNRIPAIVDHDVSGAKQTVFESGAILLYLSEKTGKLCSTDPNLRIATYEWLMWQMGGLGPMLGQNHHFSHYATEKIPYAIDRYKKETHRLYSVLNMRLKDRMFICDEYSIADIASYPWVVSYKRQGIDLQEFSNVQEWFNRIKARPAVTRAYDKTRNISNNSSSIISKQSRQILFGQTDSALL